MDQSPNLALPYIAPSQAQKHVTHNEAIRSLDALVQLSVLDRDLAGPPETPAEGSRYLVAAGASEAWEGMENRIAAYQDGAWESYSPQSGWLCWIVDEGLLLAWTGDEWLPAGGSIVAAERVGINTDSDATNRLAVKSEAILFSHDDVTPGSGDQRLKINKATDTNTASMLFQTGWSGRAEFGLTGDDDWHVKVSPDGETWQEALIVEGASGVIRFPSGVEGLRKKLTTNRTYYVRSDGDDGNGGDSDDAGGAFATLQHAFNVIRELDIGVYTVTLRIGAGSYAGGYVRSPLGTGDYVIEGDTTTPANVTITDSANNRGFWCQRGARCTIRGFKFNTTNANIHVDSGGAASLGNLEFAGGATAVHVARNAEATLLSGSSVSISADYAQVYFIDGGYLSTWGTTLTFDGPVSVSNAYVYMISHAASLQSNTTLVGGLTGRRANIGSNCYINTQGGTESYLPGTIASLVGSFSSIN